MDLEKVLELNIGDSAEYDEYLYDEGQAKKTSTTKRYKYLRVFGGLIHMTKEGEEHVFIPLDQIIQDNVKKVRRQRARNLE